MDLSKEMNNFISEEVINKLNKAIIPFKELKTQNYIIKTKKNNYDLDFIINRFLDIRKQ